MIHAYIQQSQFIFLLAQNNSDTGEMNVYNQGKIKVLRILKHWHAECSGHFPFFLPVGV